MKHTRHLRLPLLAVAIAATAACGTTTTTSQTATPDTASPDTSDVVLETTTTAPDDVPVDTSTPSPPTQPPPTVAPPSEDAGPAPIAPPPPPAEEEPVPESEPADPEPADPKPAPPAAPLPEATPVGATDIAIVPPACGLVGPIPGSATMESDLLVDIVGDGTADDRLVSYLDGGWTLRAEIDGAVSELDVPGVGVHALRVLGTADVGQVTPGPEFLATVGGGASSVEVGVFGFDADDCLFRFTWATSGDDIAVPVGATITLGSGMGCGAGWISQWQWEADGMGTYSTWGAAYEETVAGEFGYLPASDYFGEFLTEDEIDPAVLDCNGLTV